MDKEKAKKGAPTKYNAVLLEKAQQYIYVYEDLGEVCPTIEALCIYLDISRETLYRWCKEDDKKEFNDTVKKVSRTQKIVLVNKGLSGKFNAKITQLLLGANHSVIEKQSTEITGANGGPIKTASTINFIPVNNKTNTKKD